MKIAGGYEIHPYAENFNIRINQTADERGWVRRKLVSVSTMIVQACSIASDESDTKK